MEEGVKKGPEAKVARREHGGREGVSRGGRG